VLNQEPVAVNSSALDQNMCTPNNNISMEPQTTTNKMADPSELEQSTPQKSQ
jgi:hypothetical protein